MTQTGADTFAVTPDFRAGLYLLLARLLGDPPGEADLRLAAALGQDHSPTPLAVGLSRLASAAAATTAEESADQFQHLFIGIGGGEINPFASYYLTGALHDRPLVLLRRHLQAVGLRRATHVSEPEDHIATVLEIMAFLLNKSDPEGLDASRQFVREHVLNWAPRLFEDLSRNAASPLYAAVGLVGSELLAWERAGLNDKPSIRVASVGTRGT